MSNRHLPFAAMFIYNIGGELVPDRIGANVRQVLYNIYFTAGYVYNAYAFSPIDATFLAVADAIREGRSTMIDTIVNEETGEVFTFEARIRKVEK